MFWQRPGNRRRTAWTALNFSPDGLLECRRMVNWQLTVVLSSQYSWTFKNKKKKLFTQNEPLRVKWPISKASRQNLYLFLFLTRSFASRFYLRYAQRFLAKINGTINLSLYPQGLNAPFKNCLGSSNRILLPDAELFWLSISPRLGAWDEADVNSSAGTWADRNVWVLCYQSSPGLASNRSYSEMTTQNAAYLNFALAEIIQ